MTSTSLRSSSKARRLGGGASGTAGVRWTGRAEGDLGLTGGAGLEERRRAVEPIAWSFLHQVHGAEVHVVTEPGGVQAADGDALVTGRPATPLAVFTADCAPVAFASPEGVVGVAHAGWRGVEAGVIEATVEAMHRLGATRVEAVLGPCIHSCCYEFGSADLDRLAARLGDGVRGRTRDGAVAFDLPAAVATAVGRAGAELVGDHGSCTACDPGWFSYRARAEAARQATIVVGG
jgi:YfiH family protein